MLAGTLVALPAIALFGYVLLQLATNVAQAAFQAFIPDLATEQRHGIASGAKNALTVVGAAGLLGARGLSALGASDGLVLAYLAALLAVTAGLTQRWAPASSPPKVDTGWGTTLTAWNPRATTRSFARTAREHPTFRYAVTAQFLFLLGTYPAQRFLLLFLRDRFGDGAEERASLGLALAIVLAMLAAAVAGALSDAIGRRVVLAVSAIAGAVGLAAVIAACSIIPIRRIDRGTTNPATPG